MTRESSGEPNTVCEVGVYAHLPFCLQRCSYCDFNTYAGLESLYGPYVAALVEEARSFSGFPPACTLYLGGGTPTVLPPDLIRSVIGACVGLFGLPPGAEITCEANPGTLNGSYLAGLRACGVNRLTLGAQSFRESELRLLGRIHSAHETAETFRAARGAGFDNLCLDLIYGLPLQTLTAWRDTLEAALRLSPEHLSMYALSVEEGTPLYKKVAAGRYPSPDDDLVAEMYEVAEEALQEAGYVHYEISNWARPGRECRHNLLYWRNLTYLGLGAGAHSSYSNRRWWNVRDVAGYIRAVREHTPGRQPSPVAVGEERIGKELSMAETMMLGLRLVVEGVRVAGFERRYGVSPLDAYGEVLCRLRGGGLLEWDSEKILLTKRGRLLGNVAFREFLPD